ncbi:hypothetical protein BH11MYX3_BH11MYX3_28400 [soil metagenome]
MFIITSTAASVVRFPLGLRVGAIGPRPAQQLELYDIEACPYCRKVREALTMLDLDVLIRPSPHGGTRFRPTAIRSGGKRQFPLLWDPNVGELIYESDDIVAHLYARYGTGPGAVDVSLEVTRDRLAACVASAGEDAPLADPRAIDALLAKVAARCRKATCASTIGLAVDGGATATGLVEVADAVRRAGFERALIDGGVGCRVDSTSP